MPTAGMREEAQRYKDWKAEGKGGGTEVAEETHYGSSATSELLIWEYEGETPRRDTEVQK